MHLQLPPKLISTEPALWVCGDERRGGGIATQLQVSGEERAVIRKVAWRLLPFLTFVYLVAYLDRVNVGFAALTMNHDLGLTATQFGIGAGIIFDSYFLFEVPSNFALQRFGARVWIARIMISWGVISALMAFVSGPTSFYVLRFLLGVAEAGFFPGMILYLTYWFPNSARAAILGIFIIANPAATVVGAPLSTALLQTSVFGLTGWQTMFLVEGLPSVLLGFITFYVLKDSPAQAKWLNDQERAVLARAIARDEASSTYQSVRDGLMSREVWWLVLLYLALMMGTYGFGFWAPQIVKSFNVFTNTQVGLALIVPYAFAIVAMCLWGRHSDHTGERTWHFVIPSVLAMIGFVYGSFADNVYLALAGFTLGAVGIFASLPLFWTLPTALLTGSAAAGGIALINSIGNLSGFTGPFIMGRLKDATQSFTPGLLVIAASMALAAVLGYVLSRRPMSKWGGFERHGAGGA
jgi:ACS family tartrate transporter-like MFS transporter